MLYPPTNSPILIFSTLRPLLLQFASCPHIQHSTFHILIADAALYAEGGEECGDYAHDELEHGLECFFV